MWLSLKALNAVVFLRHLVLFDETHQMSFYSTNFFFVPFKFGFGGVCEENKSEKLTLNQRTEVGVRHPFLLALLDLNECCQRQQLVITLMLANLLLHSLRRRLNCDALYSLLILLKATTSL